MAFCWFACVPVQTFKPHKEKQHLTLAVSPELLTKKRALTVCSTDAARLAYNRQRTQLQLAYNLFC